MLPSYFDMFFELIAVGLLPGSTEGFLLVDADLTTPDLGLELCLICFV